MTEIQKSFLSGRPRAWVINCTLAFSHGEKEMEKTIVPTNLLCWPKVKNLIPDHKLIVLALWQNPFVTPCGAYFIDVDMFSTMLGFNKLNVEQALLDFEEKGILKFDQDTSEILICDWWRFHKCENSIQISMIQRAVDKIQSDMLKTEFFNRIKHVSNKINDLRSNHNITEPNSNTTTTDDAEASSKLAAKAKAQAVAVYSGSGNLIFDKSIHENLHQELTRLLLNVEPTLAQSKLDTLAQKIIDGERNEKLKVSSPLSLMKHFINKSFDPTLGLTISKRRENERLAEEKRLAENERKAQPKNYAGAEKFREARNSLGI